MEASRSAREARQDLYEVIRSDDPFEQKAREALRIGVGYLGVDNGHLTRIDTGRGHWEAIVSTDPPDGSFPPGLELDLATTYCRRTLAADGQVVLSDAADEGWGEDVAFETHGLHCYLGTTLQVNGEPFGTVCFVASESRETPFSDEAVMFAELMTRLLERELERDRQAVALTRQTNLATVLNRVLRHNLRNDLSVIRGYTQLMADTLDAESYGQTALAHIDNLLSLSQKARELDRVIAADNEPSIVDITKLVQEVIDDTADRFPSASFTLEADEPVSVTVLPSFERAVAELLENAAKHGGDSPHIRVEVVSGPTGVEVRIADDGPGIAEHELAVLDTGRETSLAHGTGLGLWLAYWIVTSHDGSVEATVTDAGTTLSIVIPNTPAMEAYGGTPLQRTRDRYQAAFEEAPDGMVILNAAGKILDANAKAADLCQKDRSDLLGLELAEFFPPDVAVTMMDSEWFDDGGVRKFRTTVGAGDTQQQVECSIRRHFMPGYHLAAVRPVDDSLD